MEDAGENQKQRMKRAWEITRRRDHSSRWRKCFQNFARGRSKGLHL